MHSGASSPSVGSAIKRLRVTHLPTSSAESVMPGPSNAVLKVINFLLAVSPSGTSLSNANFITRKQRARPPQRLSP